MQVLRKVDYSGECPKILAFRVPDVGDKVVDKKGFEGYCTNIYQVNGVVYEISDTMEAIECTGVFEDIFIDGVLMVK